MTDKEYQQIITIMLVVSSLFIGLFVGEAITSLRYDSEIRTDQLELKEQVAEVIEDKATIKDVIDTLLFHAEQLKLERQEVEKLRILLSKGEINVKK